MIPAAIKPTVSFADFEKLDVRVGTIVMVEEVAGADKLMKLTVDLGDMTRTVRPGSRASVMIRCRSRAGRHSSSSTWSRGA